MTGIVHCLEQNMDIPRKTREPSVFVICNDLFHEAVLTSLCWYDPRNPEGEKDQEVIADHDRLLKKYGAICHCDNCFYGRTELAEALIILKPSIVGITLACIIERDRL